MKNYLRISLLGAIAAVAAISISIGSLAFEYTDVKVAKPGDLASQLETLWDAKPEALRINGTLNSKDIMVLRFLCGNNSKLVPTDGTVKALDLTDVSFFPDGRGFLFYNNLQDSATIVSENSLPVLFLYMTNVEELKLPAKLDTIRSWALADIPLKKLYVADGVAFPNNFLYGDTLLTDLRLPFAPELYQFSQNEMKALRNVESGGFAYASQSAFWNLPEIETFTVNGPSGHIDATPFINNPRLKSIVFNGPIFSTGTCLASRCDSLQVVTFSGPVGIFGFDSIENCELPMLEKYSFKQPVLFNFTYPEQQLDSTLRNNWSGRDEFLKEYAELIKKSAISTRNGDMNAWFILSALHQLKAFSDSVECRRLIPEYNDLMAEAMTYDANKTKLQILKESAPYAEAFSDTLIWSYASPSDSILTAARVRFNLDSIAGSGDDWSKIKNLTYWIHEVIRHDGSRPDRPTAPYELGNIIEYAQKDSAGANCRMMAIALNQALLAEGIPARFLTCQSKAYDTDSDCHVINVAWSKELGKWVWCDPTFAAFVTDPDGTPLHPGEVRERLINGEELVLNEDANWNHENLQTKEDYLENYMAKNLYLISAYNVSRPLTEGPEANFEGVEQITLEPLGFGMRWTNHPTSDAASFWQPPVNTKK